MCDYQRIALAARSKSRSIAVRGVEVEDPPPEQRQKKRKRHTWEEWNTHKDAIIQTYTDHSLDETMKVMKDRCGFEASSRQYKSVLKSWGIEKNYPKDILHFVVTKHQERMSQGKKTITLFNGVQIDTEVIYKFQQRQQYPSQAMVNSPSKDTPQGIEYFTPSSPGVTGEAFYATPQVFTPVSRLSAFAVNNYENLMNSPLSLSFLELANTLRKICFVEADYGEIERGKSERAWRREQAAVGRLNVQQQYTEQRIMQKALANSEEPHCVKRHTHLQVNLAVAGCGRFEREGVLKNILWSSMAMGKKLYELVYGQRSSRAIALTIPIDGSELQEEAPKYWIDAESDSGNSFAVEPLIALLRHDPVFQLILGLDKRDARRWIGKWTPMEEDNASLLSETAKCLFGDPTHGYLHVLQITLLVYFSRSISNSTPLLLRLSFGSLDFPAAKGCTTCDTYPLALDCISATGAVKVRLSLPSSQSRHYVLRSLQDLNKYYTLHSTVFFSKWSSIAYLASGLSQTHHFRQCYCGGAFHSGGSKEHYIDMQQELFIRDDRWCSQPDILTGEDFFDPFPEKDQTNDEIIVIENLDDINRDSDEERWDPLGVDSKNFSQDIFEAHPLDGEPEDWYESRPHFMQLCSPKR